jgi:predicted ATPase/class 3 adenylate cyclase
MRMEPISSFGYWLRQRRRALDLTQDELARQVGCAIGTLKKIETDERRPSKQLAERLADCLEIPTTERTDFLKAARAELAVDRLDLAMQTSDRPKDGPRPTPLPSGTVTFLFTDIEGSTQLWERHRQAMPAALARHEAILRQAIASRGGVVFKTIGDAVCAAFASALDAVQAALAAQRALATESWAIPLRVRMALHTGVVVMHAGDYQGLPLSRVARLIAAGHGGQILLSAVTQELVRDHLPADTALHDLSVHRLKDLARPEPIFQLVAPELPSDFPPLRTLGRHGHNLPVQPTVLIGREQEVARVLQLLQRSELRLVTLTGPGGTGKTRLALQIAAELLDTFADGVWFINLAPISDPDLVFSAIGQTLGLKEAGGQPIRDLVNDYLREKQMLLLLDNCEQVLAAAPLIAELLAVAPRLKVLATSRAMLHLRGEQEVAVPPLTLPDHRHVPPLEHFGQYEAVRLFIERAQAVKADFTVTNENAPAVAEICYALDGLPLAIELAAARIKLFSPQALLARLDQRLTFLTGGARDLPARQQTLRNTIDWSYDLLSADEQALFRRLGVFVGGCTLEAAEAVCAGVGSWGLGVGSAPQSPTPVLDGLVALVDKSLLRQEEGADGEPRFTMLETIRAYALERLEESGEAAALRRQHALYYLAVTKDVGQEGEIGAKEHGLVAEIDNLRAALRWALDQREAEIALQISATLIHFVVFSEALPWLEAALALGDVADAPPATRASRVTALDDAGYMAADMGEFDRAQAHFATLMAMGKEFSAWPTVALAQRSLGWVALQRGNLIDARNWAEQSLTLCRETNDSEGIAWSLYDLGYLAFVQGELAQAEQLLVESLALFRGQGDLSGLSRACLSLGHVARAQGQFAQATDWYRESITHHPEHHHLGSSILLAVEGLAGVLGTQGRAAHAARLLGAVASYRTVFGLSLSTIDRATYERDVAAIRAQLDAAFDAAWAAGQALSLEQAIAEALGEDNGGAEPA